MYLSSMYNCLLLTCVITTDLYILTKLRKKSQGRLYVYHLNNVYIHFSKNSRTKIHNHSNTVVWTHEKMFRHKVTHF